MRSTGIRLKAMQVFRSIRKYYFSQIRLSTVTYVHILHLDSVLSSKNNTHLKNGYETYIENINCDYLKAFGSNRDFR